MKKELRDQNGFTLIEVLIAIVIMAIGILTVITMQLTSIKGNLNASNISVASGWAADQIEQIFAMAYDDINDTDNDLAAGLNDTKAADGTVTADGSAVSPDTFFEIYWNVAENVMLSSTDNTKTIRIIVLRKDMGVTKSVTMDYLKARYM